MPSPMCAISCYRRTVTVGVLRRRWPAQKVPAGRTRTAVCTNASWTLTAAGSEGDGPWTKAFCRVTNPHCRWATRPLARTRTWVCPPLAPNEGSARERPSKLEVVDGANAGRVTFHPARGGNIRSPPPPGRERQGLRARQLAAQAAQLDSQILAIVDGEGERVRELCLGRQWSPVLPPELGLGSFLPLSLFVRRAPLGAVLRLPLHVAVVHVTLELVVQPIPSPHLGLWAGGVVVDDGRLGDRREARPRAHPRRVTPGLVHIRAQFRARQDRLAIRHDPVATVISAHERPQLRRSRRPPQRVRQLGDRP